MQCTAQDCDLPAKTRSYCAKHYTRLLRYGNIETKRKPRGEALELFKRLLLHKETDKCVFWPFTTTGPDKRPWVQYDGKGRTVARHLCIQLYGEPPEGRYHAAHNCGNKHCVNPKHLRWATPKGNAADMFIHGTAPIGERQGASKLTEQDVREIRALDGTVSKSELARRYGVGNMQIGRIIRRERWAYLD